MKEKPTTFELAQLAALAKPPSARPRDAVRRAWALWHEAEVEIAEHENRAEYLRGLFRTHDGKEIPLFTDSPEVWQARLKGYPGDASDVDKALWDQEFATEEVQRQLFKDKAISRDSRQRLFLGLVKAAILFELPGPPIAYSKAVDYLASGEFVEPREGFPIHPRNLERAEEHLKGFGKLLIPGKEVRFVEQITSLLSKPRLYGHLIRWAVEVRQRQLALAKKRLVPGSLRYRRDEPDAGENIQFKRKHRQ